MFPHLYPKFISYFSLIEKEEYNATNVTQPKSPGGLYSICTTYDITHHRH